MKLKDFFAFKDWLSYRQKVGLLVIAGVVCGLGGLFMYLLRAHTYFIGDNPSACVNCHIMLLCYVEPLLSRTYRPSVKRCHLQRLPCAPSESRRILRFQGSRRFKAHSVFRGPHGASGHQGREANRSGSDGQLYPLPHTAEHGVCEDRPHGLYAAVGYRRQGVLGLSS